MDKDKQLELQNKLIKTIYNDIDGFGSIKDTFDKARMIDPTIEYDVVKQWYTER